MDNGRFSTLLSPLSVKSLRLRNRIVMPAMHLPRPSGRRPDEGLTAFYAERARGGAGLIMIGGCGIDRAGSGPYMLGIDTDEYRRDYERLNQSLKEKGAATGIQLFHAGRYSRSVDTGEPPVAPSPVRSRLTGETPRELSVAEIGGVVESFARAAARVKAWGFDSVELIASAGYLISQFLSPLTNVRTDGYGGDLEGRARFLREVLAAVRAEVGPDFPVMLRLSGSDFVEGGHTGSDVLQVARIAAEGGVDLFNVTGGWHETRVPQISGFVPPGCYAYLARSIRRAVSGGGAYVVASNRINDAAVAEHLLELGDCDLISMGRALIADPRLPAKLESGEVIIPCVACNQSCFDRIFEHRSIACLVNPRSAREDEITVDAATQRRRVIVVGGGPAGCTAAITAAERGHEVILFEKSRIGGKVALTARSYGKGEWARLPAYYEVRLAELRVRVRVGVEATAEAVLAESPDAVVVACGAEPVIPPIPGAGRPHVLTADQVLAGARTAPDVVVIGGGATGCEVALELALAGSASPEQIYFLLVNAAESYDSLRRLALTGSKTVTLVEMLPKIGEDIGRTTRWTYIQELKQRNVRVLTGAKALEIESDGVLVESRGVRQKLAAGSVVLALGYRPSRSLGEALKGLVPEVHTIGDAHSVGNAEAAIRQGFETALAI